uniref:Conserved hypothetical plastid protein n=1 Tax=Corynoplastis japonica TaxID=700918 RepID=A0A1Y9TMI4_9RHOD|nr:conserved hypothetical plastid protein [Corynoplastis japonica]
MNNFFPILYLSIIIILLLMFSIMLSAQLIDFYIKNRIYKALSNKIIINENRLSIAEYYQLSCICVYNNLLYEAIDRLQTGIKNSNSTSKDYLYNNYTLLANVYEKLNQLTLAIKYYNNALNIYDDNSLILKKLASLYSQQKNFHKVSEIYQQILLYEPDNYDIQVKLKKVTDILRY